MWIPKAINNSSSFKAPFVARIGGIMGNLKIWQPFGLKSIPKKGDSALVIPVGDSCFAVGNAYSADIALNEGEVALYSAGGAKIILKNDGTVIINGRVFEREST